MSKREIYKILARFTFLGLFLLFSNYIYVRFIFESDLQEYSTIINQVREIPENSKIIYLGESSNTSTHIDDMDLRKISEFISDYFPNAHLDDITKPAIHAGIYKILLENIRKESSLETVIITLNLRSFNAQWIYSDLETPLQKSMVLLRNNPPLINRFLLSFKAYDIKTEKEREKQIKQKWKNDKLTFPYSFPYKNVYDWDYGVARGLLDSNGVYDQSKTELAAHYVKSFAFQIDTLTNPRIIDLDEIVILAKERGWNLVFNLLAENTEKANELIGPDLIYLMEQNRVLLNTYFERKGVIVVDNLNILKNEHFTDQNWTTEHYIESGRKAVAKNVAQELKTLYPNDFTSVTYLEDSNRTFFNDCEKNTIWFEMGSLSDEKSFSGTYSSKVDKENSISILFRKKYKFIPDSSRNEIYISLKAYQGSLNSDAKLTIQTEGIDGQKSWIDIPIASQVYNQNQWNDFSYTFTIPETMKNEEIIKIFVYNPSSKPVYVDDFKIVFN